MRDSMTRRRSGCACAVALALTALAWCAGAASAHTLRDGVFQARTAQRVSPHLGAVAAAATGVSHTTRALGLQGLGDIVFDPAHQHAFISGAPNANDDAIVVTDYSGAFVGSLSGESGAGGMVVDGSTLYIARCGASAGIDLYDTATLTKTGSIAASPADTSCDLALSGGRLWYVSDQFGTLSSVTVAAPHVVTTHGTGYANANFATAPGKPDLLIVGTRASSPTVVSLIDTSGGGFAVLKSVFGLGGISDLGGIGVPDDGSTMYTEGTASTGGPSPYIGQSFSIPDLGDAGIYPLVGYPTAAAVTRDDTFVAYGVEGIYDPDVFLFPVGSETPNWKYDFGQAMGTTAFDGVRFTPDNGALFVVTQDEEGATSLTVFTDPTLIPGVVSIKARHTAITYGHSVKVTAHLGTASSNTTVSIFAKPVGGVRKKVAAGKVDSDGNFAVSVKPTRTTAFTAEWSGDDSHFTTRSDAYVVGVHVRMTSAISRGYGRHGRYHLYRYQASCPARGVGCIGYAVAVLPHHAGKKVTFVLERYRSGWRKVGTLAVKLNRRSGALIVFVYGPRSIGIRYRLQATFPGDSDHLDGHTRWTYFEVTH